MVQRNKSNPETIADLSDKEAKALEYLQVKPNASGAELAQHIGCDRTWAWRIKAKIFKMDLVELGRREARNLIPLALEAQEDCLKHPTKAETRRQAARDVLHGVGVLSDKQQHEFSLAKATPEQIKEAIAQLSDDELAALIAQRRQAADGA